MPAPVSETVTSGRVLVIVMVPPDCATLIPVPDAIVAVPPPAPPAVESVSMPDVVPETESVCASFVTLPSTSVPVIVIDPPLLDVLSEIVRIPAALIVTPVAPDVLDMIVEEDAPPAPTPKTPSLLTLPSTSVPVIVKLG